MKKSTENYEQDGTTDLCEWFTEADVLKEKLVGLAHTGVMYVFPDSVK